MASLHQTCTELISSACTLCSYHRYMLYKTESVDRGWVFVERATINLDYGYVTVKRSNRCNKKLYYFTCVLHVFFPPHYITFILVCLQIPNTNISGAVVVMIVWQLDLQLPEQSVHIATKVVSLNPVHGEVYMIQHYVINLVRDMRQVSDFLRVL